MEIFGERVKWVSGIAAMILNNTEDPSCRTTGRSGEHCLIKSEADYMELKIFTGEGFTLKPL